MKIRSVRLLPYRLPLRQPWRNRHGMIHERTGWIVELTTDSGMLGLGDCAPLRAAGTEAASDAENWLHQYLPQIRLLTPSEALELLPLSCPAPAARCALETALLDLISQSEACSLHRWLDPRAVESIGINASAGSLDASVASRCRSLTDRGFRTLKLKVGVFRPEQELERLHRLDRQLPAQIQLRLDANGAWAMEEAKRFLAGMPQRVESLEEPLTSPRPGELAVLQARTQAALALDESLPGMPVNTLLNNPPVKRLVLKPTVLGGLLPAMALARQAAQAGMQTLVTSTLESAIGIRAAVQLAAAIPQPEPLDHGLATSEWLTTDIMPAPEIVKGRISLPQMPGLGIDQALFASQANG
jgi:o-succinylbenzoate synthase